MSFTKQTLRDVNVERKRVLLRADYNVPLDENGNITDDFRIRQSLLTLKTLLAAKAKVVICTHLGRPKSPKDSKYSLKPVAEHLSQLLGKKVHFSPDCVGKEAERLARGLDPGQILLLENLRFHPEEKANDEEFAKRLAGLGELFVQDGFGVVHRAHASTDAITRFLPSAAGLLLEREMKALTAATENPARPLMTILGGAKIADKIDILDRFIDIADFVAVGGAMANTFLLANGIDIGNSKAETGDIDLAKEIIEKAKDKAKRTHFTFYIPQDGVVATSLEKTASTRIVDWDAHVIASIEHYPKRPPRTTAQVKKDELILDIGPFSGAFIAGGMQLASTVIWNGAMGVTEAPGLQGPVGPFAHGTEIIVEAMLGQYGNKPFTVVGGGDTVGFLVERKLVERFNHVSTGGGATLELLSGKPLPGIEALTDRQEKFTLPLSTSIMETEANTSL